MLHVDKMDMHYNLNYYHWMYLTLKTGRTGTFLTGQVEHLNHSDVLKFYPYGLDGLMVAAWSLFLLHATPRFSYPHLDLHLLPVLPC